MSVLQSRAFGCLALLYLIVLYWAPFTGSALLKALPIWYLAVLAWQNRAPALALALLVASAGDVLLAYDAFVPGLAAFLVAQLFYAVLFARRFQWRGDRLPLVLMLLLWSGSLLLLIGPQLGALAAPVYAYVVAILAMGLAALLSRQRLWPGAAGAACFILSDSLIALGLFQTPLPAHGWAVMATYYLAQWLITNALIDQAQDR